MYFNSKKSGSFLQVQYDDISTTFHTQYIEMLKEIIKDDNSNIDL